MNITTSASCSMAPDSRRSESWGPRSSRSGARVSWLRTRTGICSSLARPFRERETFVALEAARFGADFEDGDGAGVVNPNGGGGDGAEGFRHAAPVFAGEMAGAEFVGVDLRDRGNETLEERLLGHFEAENGDGLAGADADVLGEVEGER